jgi:dTDP-4-dehydrorhamnose reductase
MRLFVTGGSGYLGSELVRRAPPGGWAVAAPTSAELDVRDEDAVGRALDAFRPDALIHTAYRLTGSEARSTNVDGAAAVARAAATAGSRLVHLSTDVVFDGTRRGRYREEDEPAPVYEYGSAKADAERLVAAAHPRALIVRTSLIYGGAEPGPQERLAADGAQFFVDEIRSPVQVGDLAEALLELVALEHPGPLHLGGADDISRFDFAVLLGADPERIERANTTPNRAPDVTLDSSLAAGLLQTRLRGAYEVLSER